VSSIGGASTRMTFYSTAQFAHLNLGLVSVCVLQVLSQLDRHPVVVGTGRSEPLSKLTRLARDVPFGIERRAD
jgi:hypothetical protein